MPPIYLHSTSGTIIYFDMEAYATNNTPCRQATDMFIRGWNYQLQQNGRYAGVYGAGCGSAASDWAWSSASPNDVWIAAWSGVPSVWGLACVWDGLWNQDQRIHQYLGNSSETYWGVNLIIDRNCASGRVANVGHGSDPQCVNPP